VAPTLDRVRPYENNPRNNDKAVDAVAASIKEFGFSQPIVVDTDSVIIVGHTRLKAALKLGLERVPVVVASHLTPEQVRAYRIADNKTAEIAGLELLGPPIYSFGLDGWWSVSEWVGGYPSCANYEC
jgi:ParB-like chromosome segregation protein Spo0J